MPRTQKSLSRGFTLVEVLVISPILVIVVAVLVGLMISLTGNVIQSRERAAMVYDVQTALDQIESDVRISTRIVNQTPTLTSPQGVGGGTGAFSSNANILVLEQLSTTKSPFDPSRQLLYYANQPNPCDGSHIYNTAVRHFIVYFLDGNQLKRRTIVDFGGNSVCDIGTKPRSAGIWQNNTCATINKFNQCVSPDLVVANNISDIDIDYFSTPSSLLQVLTPNDNTASLRVQLTKQVDRGGDTLSHSARTRVSRIK